MVKKRKIERGEQRQMEREMGKDRKREKWRGDCSKERERPMVKREREGGQRQRGRESW